MKEHDRLPQLLRLAPGGEPDLFVGQTESYPLLGIYGGHLLGQALAAALATVDETKRAQSLHASFLKAGNPELPLQYRVGRLREGRGTEVRTVAALQGGEPIAFMQAAFKPPETGDTHQPDAPASPVPEALIAAREARGEAAFSFPMTLKGRVELEFISESFKTETFRPGREPALRMWMRVPGGAGADPHTQQSMLAFLADGTLMFNAVLPHGLPFRTHRLTSLDQSVWFHRPVDAGDWLLYDQHSSAAADGRGLNEGRVFDRHGHLIATTMQESMLRRIS